MAGSCHLGEREVKAQGLGHHHILCSSQGSWRDGGGSRETVGKGQVIPLIPRPADTSISRCYSTGQGHTESAREPGTLQQASCCEIPPDHSHPLSGQALLLAFGQKLLQSPSDIKKPPAMLSH